jgi:hypothetical protein
MPEKETTVGEGIPFLSKKEHKQAYEGLLIILNKHIKPKALEQLQHNYNSQKNEAMNSSIAKLAPKDLTFSQTRSLQYRVAIAISIDSIGWIRFIGRLLTSLNPNVVLSSVLMKFLAKKQKRKEYWKERQKELSVKRRRKQYVVDKIKRQKVDDIKASKQWLIYESGAALDMEDEDDDEDLPGNEDISGNEKVGDMGEKYPTKRKNNKATKNKPAKCRCGSDQHARTSHQSCKYNKKNQQKLKEGGNLTSTV